MSSKLQIIQREIKKHQMEILRLATLKEMIWEKKLDNKTLTECPICKTNNYHWNVENNSWTCAFC